METRKEYTLSGTERLGYYIFEVVVIENGTPTLRRVPLKLQRVYENELVFLTVGNSRGYYQPGAQLNLNSIRINMWFSLTQRSDFPTYFNPKPKLEEQDIQMGRFIKCSRKEWRIARKIWEKHRQELRDKQHRYA